MTAIALGNAVRSSNLINLNYRELKDVALAPEYNNARSIKSLNYKTSLLYGEKMILLPEVLYQLLVIYFEKLRPLFIQDDNEEDHERFIFTSSRGIIIFVILY